MDDSDFDTLARTLATTRLSRGQTLRGLAMSVATLIGLRLVAEEAEAKQGGKKTRRKKRVCLCSAAGCFSKKVRNRSKVISKNAPCAYAGGCTTNPCVATAPPPPGAQCTNNNDCNGGLVCIRQQCVTCTADFQCTGNTICLSGTCQASPPCIPESPTTTCGGGCGVRLNNCNQPVPCPSCRSGQDCLPNGTCARECTNLGGQCAGCTPEACSLPSSEGPSYCIGGGDCENFQPCDPPDITGCPQGFVCLPDCGTSGSRCAPVAVCPAT